MNDRGSTFPLILGVVVIGIMTSAAAVAAGDAYVQQRGLQAVCDGAATAAAAAALDLGRTQPLDAGGVARFGDAQAAVDHYLARDSERRGVQATTEVSPDGRTLAVTCMQREHIAFGAVFGKASGVRHVARSAAQAPLGAPQ